jgi:alpha-tubulin suppressor-like RCC1 family protein
MKSPSVVAGGLTFKEISVGTFHACALSTNGAAYCWGGNGYGRLGNNSTVLKSIVPVPVSGGLTFAAIIAERSEAPHARLNVAYRMTRPLAAF